jgi:hypothetical protein
MKWYEGTLCDLLVAARWLSLTAGTHLCELRRISGGIKIHVNIYYRVVVVIAVVEHLYFLRTDTFSSLHYFPAAKKMKFPILCWPTACFIM